MSDKKKVSDIPTFSLLRYAKFEWGYDIDGQSSDSYELYLVPTSISGIRKHNGKVKTIFTSDGHAHSVDTTLEEISGEVNRALDQALSDTKEVKKALMDELEQAFEKMDEDEGNLKSLFQPVDVIPKKGDLN